MSDTYFTVENVKYELKNNNNISSKILQEKNEFEKSQFKEIEQIIEEVLNSREYNIKYEECNNRTFMKIIINNLENSEIFKLRNKISKEIYHIEIYKKYGKDIVDIHTKGLM